jgi:hypothetical protein
MPSAGIINRTKLEATSIHAVLPESMGNEKFSGELGILIDYKL